MLGLALLVLCGASARTASADERWIEPRLARRLDASARASALPQDELRVVVEPARGRRGADLPLARLRALGARVERVSRTRARIAASPAVLARIAELEGVAALRFPFVPVAAEGTGAIVSQAPGVTGLSALQAQGISGAGVDVAVVDIGFQRLAEARAAGEIRASAIELDLTGQGMEQFSSHGTAVAEQVADAAPGARLHLIRVEDDVDLEAAVDYVHDQGIRIVNLSLNWFGQSYYDDTGPISGLVNASHDEHGVFWAVAVGNWRYRHWRGPWLDEDEDGWLSFSAGDETLGLVEELAHACVTLNWNQYPEVYGGVRSDVDLFVYDANGAQVAESRERQSAGALPLEVACFDWQTAGEPYDVRVRRFSGPTIGLDLTLVSGDTALEGPHRIGPGSVVDPAVAHGAFSVGAIDHAIWDRVDPPPNLDWFSSFGPTRDARQKPDLVAPNRTQSLTRASAQGTSFASPVVAGAAALLLQQNVSLSNLQLRAALLAVAEDTGPLGRDPYFGWGKLVAATVGAAPDSDGDGIVDASDPCPFAVTPSQADANGDGIGDGCQCGDASGDGLVGAADAVAIRSWLARAGPAPAGLERCNVRGPAIPAGIDCKADDLATLRRALAGRAPGIEQSCAPALPP